MNKTASTYTEFSARHIGLSSADIDRMLSTLSLDSMQALMDEVIPASIIRKSEFEIGEGLSEAEILAELSEFADMNNIATSLIGMGYYGCHMPAVIQRNVLENPAWYTAYTPYQPEISQGRLEAILNFQTMVAELTGMDIANGSLLDEATAAAEAMMMAFRLQKTKHTIFRVDADTHPQTLAILETRARPLGIEINIAPAGTGYDENIFGALISYPSSEGQIRDIGGEISQIKAAGGMAIVASDLLALACLEPPGKFGADIVLG
ncbi:MAG: glycine dehydrogenase (aminomethyl-transferring), partial [Candidatus Puniceispirillaceae bacterium]